MRALFCCRCEGGGVFAVVAGPAVLASVYFRILHTAQHKKEHAPRNDIKKAPCNDSTKATTATTILPHRYTHVLTCVNTGEVRVLRL